MVYMKTGRYRIIVAIVLSVMVLGLGNGLADDKPAGSIPVFDDGLRDVATDNNMFADEELPSIKGLVKSFFVVIGLIVLFFVFLRWRYGFSSKIKGAKKNIQVVEHLMLGPKKYLYLVKVLDRLLVIGTSNDGLSLLCEMDESEKRELLKEPAESGDGFASLIKKISRGKDTK